MFSAEARLELLNSAQFGVAIQRKNKLMLPVKVKANSKVETGVTNIIVVIIRMSGDEVKPTGFK